MASKLQYLTRKDSDNLKEIRVHDANHTPSWKRPGTVSGGYAAFRAYGCDNWLSVSLEEGYKRENARGYTGRDAMMTFNKASAMALRDLLNELYPAE